ncbi:MAG: 6-carboxytetrahydropterin synthase [Candidatus Marinimicrobia bacterium]|nr:6-carboxytetrahydropterin synthase [Candidatus Neomarinimicrobiota bacterium]
MSYRICKILEVESGHMLSRHAGVCQFPHGHSRRVEVILAAPDLDERQMVCDFKVVRAALDELLATLDHALCVNTADPHFETLRQAFGERVLPFENQDPTTEIIARFIYDRVAAELNRMGQQSAAAYPVRPIVRLERVRVWETSTSWAEYAPLQPL